MRRNAVNRTDWEQPGTAYGYPFGNAPFGLPDSRIGRAGALDAGTQALARSGRRINMRLTLDTLERNPEESGRRRWTLVDSLGRELAVIEQHRDRWELSEPQDGPVIYRDGRRSRGHLLVQGRGCMADDDLEERHALVAFNASDRSTIPPAASIIPYRLRAFIDRRALPRRTGLTRVRGAVDDFAAGRGESPEAAGTPATLEDPGFGHTERFLGTDGRRRTYATYNAKRPYAGAIYLSINTTGVHGGGIVRGVARAGDELELLDEIGYCDPNAASGTPIAGWNYGRVAGTRLEGWIPERCANGSAVRPSGSPGR